MVSLTLKIPNPDYFVTGIEPCDSYWNPSQTVSQVFARFCDWRWSELSFCYLIQDRQSSFCPFLWLTLRLMILAYHRYIKSSFRVAMVPEFPHFELFIWPSLQYTGFLCSDGHKRQTWCRTTWESAPNPCAVCTENFSEDILTASRLRVSQLSRNLSDFLAKSDKFPPMRHPPDAL